MGSTHTSLPNGLVIFTCVVSITSFVLYFGTWCIGSFFSRRDRSRRSRGQDVHHDPPAITQDERGDSVGDGPRVSDVLIDSWYPLCPQLESQSGMLKPIRGKGESGKRVAASPANDWKWEKILPLSADKVSDVETIVSSSQVKVGTGNNLTPSTQIQIHTIILMPSRPSPSFPLASSSNFVPSNPYHPPGDYALGTSSFPYTSDD